MHRRRGSPYRGARHRGGEADVHALGFTEQDMAATKRLGAAFCPDAGFNPGKIFTNQAQPHRESELYMPVPQASLMYV